MKAFDALKAAAEDIPDADHIWTAPDGETWFRFLVEYKSADGTMATDLWARDIDHAEALLASLKASAEVIGQAYRTIDE